MEASDHGRPRPSALDALLRRFVESGHAPGGAELDAEEFAGDQHGHGHGQAGAVREFEHRGHRVQVVTRYEVTIDGEPWEQPIHVQNDGNVMYHGLPQYVVPSAVDLIRGVIDHGYEAPEEIRDAIAAARADH